MQPCELLNTCDLTFCGPARIYVAISLLIIIFSFSIIFYNYGFNAKTISYLIMNLIGIAFASYIILLVCNIPIVGEHFVNLYLVLFILSLFTTAITENNLKQE